VIIEYMSYMFEVYYKGPVDQLRELKITNEVRRCSGRLTYREEPDVGGPSSAICLTFEFDELKSAEKASGFLRQAGEHVEEIQPDYPDD
jgi:hypothetical protein